MAKMTGDEKIVVPSKYTVGFRVREKPDTEKFPLAFATPFGTDAAYKKRLETVKSWCGNNSYYRPTVYVPNSKEERERTGEYYARNPDGSYVEVPNPEPPAPDAIIIDLENVPIKGFAMDDVVSRYTTDNKVFNIKDPRGFTLQVYADNFLNLLLNDTVVKGVFQGEYVWGRYGGKNFLMSTSDPLYETSKEYVKKEASWTYPKIGDKFESGQVYVGDVFICYIEYNSYDPDYNWMYTKNTKIYRTVFEHKFGFDPKPWHMLRYDIGSGDNHRVSWSNKRKFSSKTDLVVESGLDLPMPPFGMTEGYHYFGNYKNHRQFALFPTKEALDEYISNDGAAKLLDGLKGLEIKRHQKRADESLAWRMNDYKRYHGKVGYDRYNEMPVIKPFEHTWVQVEEFKNQSRY